MHLATLASLLLPEQICVYLLDDELQIAKSPIVPIESQSIVFQEATARTIKNYLQTCESLAQISQTHPRLEQLRKCVTYINVCCFKSLLLRVIGIISDQVGFMECQSL